MHLNPLKLRMIQKLGLEYAGLMFQRLNDCTKKGTPTPLPAMVYEKRVAPGLSVNGDRLGGKHHNRLLDCAISI